MTLAPQTRSVPGTVTRTPNHRRSGTRASSDFKQRLLLSCGIVASIFYVLINCFVAVLADGYSMKSQTVSELSAIGSPTRPLWMALIIPYGLMMMAFGWGVYRSGVRDRSLRAVGLLFILNSVVGAFWPPMHARGTEPTLTDTLHIAFTIVTILIFIAQMAFAAFSLKGPFAVYTAMSVVIMLAFGTLTSIEAPGIQANLPTPMIGVWERLSIGSYVVWVSVFAGALLSGQWSTFRAVHLKHRV